MYKQLLSMVLMFLLIGQASFVFAKNDDDKEKKAEKLKADARELLRETSGMIQTLSSPTNRITFTIKSADILWKVDENEARSMFNSSIDDVRRLMSQVEIEANQRSQNSTRVWGRRNSSSRNSSSKNVYSLRSSLITTLANHDPEWAMQILQETSQIITSKNLVKRIERDNKRLERTIVRKIASKDVTKALELAKEKLSKGVTSETVSLLSQIYRKDSEKGADFARDVLQKLKSSDLKSNQIWLLVRLFQYGLRKPADSNTPLFDKSSMTDLADLIATQVTSPSSRYRSLSSSVMKGIEQYSPNSAAQIKRTFDQKNAARNSRTGRGGRVGTGSRGSGGSSSRSYWQQRQDFQKDLNTDLNRLNDESLSTDDKRKIINEARDKILSVEDNSFSFTNLISLAYRANGINEKELASSILGEAETLTDQDPKARRDFSRSRNLASAYAVVDTDKSFVILENMVYRLNDVINGFIKYKEFSGNGSTVENNELLMNNRNRQFTNYLRLSSTAMKSLAETDYNRLKDLTDRFERPEIRVELRLLLARGLLAPRRQNNMIYTSTGFTTSRFVRN